MKRKKKLERWRDRETNKQTNKQKTYITQTKATFYMHAIMNQENLSSPHYKLPYGFIQFLL